MEDVELLCKIGEGGFSEVYQVVDRNSGDIYAAKFTPSKLFQNTHTPSEIDRATDAAVGEGKLMESLPSCDYIVQYHQLRHLSDGRMALLMEFCDGKPLASPDFHDKSVLFWKKVVYSILIAMHVFHQRAVIHLDMKWENIIHTDRIAHKKDTDKDKVICDKCDDEFGGIKVIDFGSALAILEGEEFVAARSTTISHASPEVRWCRCGYPVSDVWSLGTMLLERFGRNKGIFDPLDIAEKAIPNLQDIGYSHCCGRIQEIVDDFLEKELDGFCAHDLSNLIKSILIVDHKRRPTPEKLQNHEWFRNVHLLLQTTSSFNELGLHSPTESSKFDGRLELSVFDQCVIHSLPDLADRFLPYFRRERDENTLFVIKAFCENMRLDQKFSESVFACDANGRAPLFEKVLEVVDLGNGEEVWTLLESLAILVRNEAYRKTMSSSRKFKDFIARNCMQESPKEVQNLSRHLMMEFIGQVSWSHIMRKLFMDFVLSVATKKNGKARDREILLLRRAIQQMSISSSVLRTTMTFSDGLLALVTEWFLDPSFVKSMLSAGPCGKFAKSWISCGLECGLGCGMECEVGCCGIRDSQRLPIATEWLFECQNIMHFGCDVMSDEWRDQIRRVLDNMGGLFVEESLEHLRITLFEAVESGSLHDGSDYLQYSLMIPIQTDACRKTRIVCGSTSSVQCIAMKNAFSVETPGHFYAEFDCIRCGEIRIGWSEQDSLCVHLGRTLSSVSIDHRGFLRNNDVRHGPKMKKQWRSADTLGVSLEWNDSGFAIMHWYGNGVELPFNQLENIMHAKSLFLTATLSAHAFIDCVHPSCMQFCPSGCTPIQLCACGDE
eukprot:TRINITY_DN31688_c0_g1_i1.p1 TRINITY_DN31688_c0_g1~~TRINITY_DN31688_c0_g1_i1.p1  ORF type:complete len:845 (-),score=156.34 TRINITY_DN31688_c0_g1_i1:18-2522(-)